MDKVFEKTRELAAAIKQSPAYIAMQEAENKTAANVEAASVMAQFAAYRSEVEELLADADADKARLKELSDKMDACQERLEMMDEVIALSKARADFSNLIGQMNQLLRFLITGDMGEGSCSGSCSGCNHCSN